MGETDDPKILQFPLQGGGGGEFHITVNGEMIKIYLSSITS